MKDMFLSLPLAALLFLAAGCAREHQCKCVTETPPDDGLLKIMVVEGSMNCEDIKEMSFEIHAVDSTNNARSLARRDVRTVSCREYGDN